MGLFDIIFGSHSGKCGYNLKWKFNNNVLTISGTDRMYNYDTDYGVTWRDNRNLIQEFVIENGVESIGSFAFAGCKSLWKIKIPYTVTRINDISFYGCTSLMEIKFPDSLELIGTWAFCWCTSLSGSVKSFV